MTDEQFSEYQQKRKAIIKEYNSKALKQVCIVLAIAAVVLAAVILICTLVFENGPLAIVISLIVGLFAVIYGWMRVIVINHAKEKKLHEFEDNSLLRKF